MSSMRLSRRRGKLPPSDREGGSGMASAQVAAPETIKLTDDERLVLATLEDAKRPMDVIALATATSLSVERTLEAVERLKANKVVAVQPPEPIRERVQVEESALQRVG
jgi:hypothetical protein